MTKSLIRNDVSCITKKDFSGIEDEVVIFFYKDSIDTGKLSKRIQKGIVIFNDTATLQMTGRGLTFGIDQEVYLYDLNTSELYEVYKIMNVKIKSKLGVLQNRKQFIWSKDVIQR